MQPVQIALQGRGVPHCEKIVMIHGLAPSSLKLMAVKEKMMYGYLLEWTRGDRLLVTGKADVLKKEKMQRDSLREDRDHVAF